jgi:dinuclear metal center YbgI/SA1388 family protein
MARQKSSTPVCTVADFVSAMDAIAPTNLAQDWDNVGLIAGDPSAALERVLLCIDLTGTVVDEAVRRQVDLVMAYHPPIFKPMSSLRADSTGTDSLVFRCISSGIAIYSTHTALDAADGGTNDTIAAFCGVRQTEPLEYVDDPNRGSERRREFKLVVFVPHEEVDRVADAMFEAGAGHIGNYSRCSYRLRGQGTFLGGESTNPTRGRKGRLEDADEVRLETVVPGQKLAAVVGAMVEAHSYEEPAFDIYPLKPRPVWGIGRVGALPEPVSLAKLARKLKGSTVATSVQIVGCGDRMVDRAIVVVGAAGSLPFRMNLTGRDVIVTGEMRHHDALAVERLGCSAITLGHWASERPTLAMLSEKLERVLGVSIQVSEVDCDVFNPA